ncbi:MAG: phytanoyl-CoA dioxygenase [Phenylobacterium sp.]|nr:phytanoyl-CoA dioxygenase [Phenylobacterium sp.]
MDGMAETPPRLDVDAHVREVTDAELRSYWRNGWVKLEALLSPELAGGMLEAAKALMLPDQAAAGRRIGDGVEWRDRYCAGRDEGVEPFASLLRAPTIGRNARRLMRRGGAALHSDIVAVKMPKGQPGSGPTAFHQDAAFPLDRTGQLIIWVAMGDMTPEMGTMRFLSGSFREGPLGDHRRPDGGGRELLEYYPYLEEEYEWSPPMSLKAGDAIVLHVVTIHGAPANLTDQPRWAYIMNYHPTDARWTGAPSQSAFVRDCDLQPGDLIRSEKFYYFPEE